MGILKKYYETICKKRQEQLMDLYIENYATKYRSQDILDEEKEANKNGLK
ncbi:hypothetical protein [Aminipila sp.]|nr:hypothetical protein [Aminipila sp.]